MEGEFRAVVRRAGAGAGRRSARSAHQGFNAGCQPQGVGKSLNRAVAWVAGISSQHTPALFSKWPFSFDERVLTAGELVPPASGGLGGFRGLFWRPVDHGRGAPWRAN